MSAVFFFKFKLGNWSHECRKHISLTWKENKVRSILSSWLIPVCLIRVQLCKLKLFILLALLIQTLNVQNIDCNWTRCFELSIFVPFSGEDDDRRQLRFSFLPELPLKLWPWTTFALQEILHEILRLCCIESIKKMWTHINV